MSEKREKIIQLFNQPFPYIQQKWLIVVVSSLWILLIAVILKPLGIELVKNKQFVTILFISMAVSVIALVVYGFPVIFRRFHNPDSWTFGKYLSIPICIVIIFSPLAAIVTYLVCLKENIPITISPVQQLLIWIVRSLFISIFPTLIFYFINKNYQRTDINRKTINPDSSQNDLSNEPILLSGTTKDTLEVIPEELLYAEVLGNYVTIYYQSGNQVLQKSLRTTLQQIMESLQSYPEFVRCHRAFAVNLSKITNLRGNSHAYKLTLGELSTEVPVSKSYTKLIKEKLDL